MQKKDREINMCNPKNNYRTAKQQTRNRYIKENPKEEALQINSPKSLHFIKNHIIFKQV